VRLLTLAAPLLLLLAPLGPSRQGPLLLLLFQPPQLLLLLLLCLDVQLFLLLLLLFLLFTAYVCSQPMPALSGNCAALLY